MANVNSVNEDTLEFEEDAGGQERINHKNKCGLLALSAVDEDENDSFY